MHLVGFIIRIYQDARSSECQVHEYILSGQGLLRSSQNSEVHHVIYLCVCEREREIEGEKCYI